MKWPKISCVLILAATIAALALRLPQLDRRPMHGDEAVHAVKFGSLLEEGYYRYDPHEYHGPTLNYLTLIPAWLSSARKLTDLSESTLRIVPVSFGVLLVLLLLPMAGGLGRPIAVVAALLTAISPAMVFYSRYYIQEVLLVCFTFGAIISGYRYTQSKNIKWAIFAGISLGLMHATKETSVIAFGSMLLALLLTLIMRRRQGGSVLMAVKAIDPWHGIAAVAAAGMVSALFYSSFFTNAGGIVDSVYTWKTYLNRAAQSEWHLHPWYYYLKMLIYSRYDAGPAWSEALIIVLAGIGFYIAMRGRSMAESNVHLLRFIAFYALIMTGLYSIIPYKTPWNLLGFLHGLILLAGVGAVALVRYRPNVLARVLISLLLVTGGGHLAWQACLASYRYYADPANPYVYAHSSTDVVDIARRVEEIARCHPDGYNLAVEVICPGDDYWPLPWYLRSFPNAGWWNMVDDDVPAAPIIIASPSVEKALVRKLYELPAPGEINLYVPLFSTYMELRPQVELRGYVVKDLWDRFQQYQAQSGQSPTR
ncbi:MAG: TIGR03663 family protein [Calditrichaeota bacterium]|nr:TIGR03663 family protein [Calditrichota bacterium]